MIDGHFRAQSVPVEVAFVGIGNTLAGDDGAGIAVVTILAQEVPDPVDAAYLVLEGDLYAITDLLTCARRFVFVDACLGAQPGSIVVRTPFHHYSQPSLHLTDMGTVMHQLSRLSLVDLFPRWEIRGISVVPPFTLGEGLSEPVQAGVRLLADQLVEEFFPGVAARRSDSGVTVPGRSNQR